MAGMRHLRLNSANEDGVIMMSDFESYLLLDVSSVIVNIDPVEGRTITLTIDDPSGKVRVDRDSPSE